MANRDNDRLNQALENARMSVVNAANNVALQYRPQQRQQPLLPRPRPLLARPQPQQLPQPQQRLPNLRVGFEREIRNEMIQNSRLEEQRRRNEILREQERMRARQMIDEYQRLEAQANEEKSMIGKDLFYEIN